MPSKDRFQAALSFLLAGIGGLGIRCPFEPVWMGYVLAFAGGIVIAASAVLCVLCLQCAALDERGDSYNVRR